VFAIRLKKLRFEGLFEFLNEFLLSFVDLLPHLFKVIQSLFVSLTQTIEFFDPLRNRFQCSFLNVDRFLWGADLVFKATQDKVEINGNPS
jgi:hypothetical protein